MPHETEVHFCNICNTSIPEAALRDGAAVRIDGRLVPTASPPPPPGEGVGLGRGPLFGAAFVVLAGIAGATVFVDWRLSAESTALRQELDGSTPRLTRLEDRLAGLEARLATVARADQFGGIETTVRAVGDRLGGEVAGLQVSVESAERARTAIAGQMREFGESQVQHAARLALLQDDVRALGRDFAELRAAPVSRTPDQMIDDGRGSALDPVVRAEPEAMGFPPELQHHIDRLGDADESVRFEAVQELLASGVVGVLPPLVPLAKDPDFFVRRLVLEGLADHRSVEHVELMLTALADPESLVRHSAYQGLKKLTGQNLPFDADAGSEQRGSMQRRWRAWWDKNRDSF